MISLKKTSRPGTQRFLGERVAGVDPAKIPIAGVSRTAIVRHLNGTCYGIGRVSLQNAFVVEHHMLHLVYVRPDYDGYRKVANRIFLKDPWEVHIDHSLGRKLASANAYAYVLLMRLNPLVNTSHGAFERPSAITAPTPALCFLDERIKNKSMGRFPIRGNGIRPAAFDPSKATHGGMTLKQAGQWAYAVGLEDHAVVHALLTPLHLARR